MFTCQLTSGTTAASWDTQSLSTARASSGKVGLFSNTLTLAGTDATTITFQGTDTYMGRGTTDTITGAKTFGDTKLLMRNVANTFNGSFTNTNTADRIYTLPDRALTIDNITTATTSN